jgi:hypothetical protein
MADLDLMSDLDGQSNYDMNDHTQDKYENLIADSARPARSRSSKKSSGRKSSVGKRSEGGPTTGSNSPEDRSDDGNRSRKTTLIRS